MTWNLLDDYQLIHFSGGGEQNPYPNSWINPDGTINCNGIVYCDQPIPCGE